MEKKYFSIDIESSGPIPGKYAMLSLGACVVGNTDINFYREIKPISMDYVLDSIKVASRGLKCLEPFKKQKKYNPDSKEFDPMGVIYVLNERGEYATKVMRDFEIWVNENSKGFRAIEVAAPIKFDGMFTAWYFYAFNNGRNPFGHSGEDINSMYRGVMRNTNANINMIKIENKNPHNALEDAIEQAKKFEKILGIIKS